MKTNNNMNVDPMEIALCLKRRPAYVQYYCILQCVSMNSKLRLYQLARLLSLDYYQVMKHVNELSGRGFLQVKEGVVSLTDDGRRLKDALENLIILLHAADIKGNEKRRSIYNILA